MEEPKEWVFETMGLKIAMVSWGRRWRPGVLLLHGYEDSAATFAPLVKLLPDTYYYVCFDFPGHGKSDFLPAGPLPTHSFVLEVIRRVVLHLQWETFMCIGHSMGGMLGMLHSFLHPGQLTRLVCLDPIFALMLYIGMAEHDSKFVSPMFYEQYYDVIYQSFRYFDGPSAIMVAGRLRNCDGCPAVKVVSWGRRWRPGVLLLHGHGDSAATFAPLVKLLPDTYYYVCFDFPGHGKSDFLPAGPLPTHSFVLEVIRRVVLHLQWETFMCIGHSMGGVLGMLHSYLHPGQLTRLVCLDPIFALMLYIGMAEYDSQLVSPMFYELYYDVIYQSFSQPKISSYEEALNSVMQLRKLARKPAEEILARNLTSVGEGLYKVSPQKAAFTLAHIPATYDIVEHIFKNISLPMLLFHTSHSLSKYRRVQFTSEVIGLFDDKSDKYKVVCVEGSHDQHFVRPEVFVSDIVEFLGQKSKI